MAGPFGSVKEQSSGLYAQELAARGFVTMAFDPSFTGESGGEPRRVGSPDICTEDFSAAVDFLVCDPGVDPSQVGIVGICGWGGFALNAAAADTRIRATVTSTMYDITRVSALGYNDSVDADGRYAMREELSAQRTADARSGVYQRVGGFPEHLPDEAPRFMKDYFDYYRSPRGFHPRSANSTDGWNITAAISYANTRILAYAAEIRSAVLIVAGEKAHSRYMSEDAFDLLTGDNKELLVVPGASHTDLYDDGDYIPFDRIADFLSVHVAQ